MIGEDVSGTEHPKIMRANEKRLSTDQIQKLIERALVGIMRQDSKLLGALLSQVVDGFEYHKTAGQLESTTVLPSASLQ